MIEAIIRKLKNDDTYHWDNEYAVRDVTIITFTRAVQAVRGLLLKLRVKKASGIIFRGRSVMVKHAYNITTGKNLILDDGTTINALSFDGIKFGDNVSIGRDSILFCTGVIAQKGTGIIIGDRTGINARAYIAGQGGVKIGSDVITGPGISVFSENHNFNNLNQSIKDQGVTRIQTVIGNNCWLGADCKILAGVIIGDGCVIAAGAVVTTSFPANSVVAGVPAKVIKTRQ